MENEIYLLLRSLFDKAKFYDDLSEWEFIQTILRDKYSNNMYTPSQVIKYKKIYDGLIEEEKNDKFRRQVLYDNIKSVYSFIKVGNMLHDYFDDMIRIRLLTYSYITEIKYIQNVLANLLWISISGNFYPNPFDYKIINKLLSKEEIEKISKMLNININKNDTLKETKERIKLICFLCEKTGLVPLKDYIESFYNNHFRNSIYHSKFFVSKDGFVGIDKKSEVRFSRKEMAEKIDKCIYFFITVIELLDEYSTQYCGIKTIKGRQPDHKNNNINSNNIVDIDIVARKNGGIVSTIVRTYSSNKIKDETDDGFYKDLLNFMSEFQYNSDEDK